MSRPRCSSMEPTLTIPSQAWSRNRLPPFGDKPVDDPPQRQHGYAAAGHHRVVELAEVVFPAQRLLRVGAQPVDLAVSHLVAAGLAWPGTVPIHFARDLLDRGAIGAREPVDGLLTRPALDVQTGVDDQPAGTERNRLQVAE